MVVACLVCRPAQVWESGLEFEMAESGGHIIVATGEAADNASGEVEIKTTACDAAKTLIFSEISRRTGKTNVSGADVEIKSEEVNGRHCRLKAVSK